MIMTESEVRSILTDAREVKWYERKILPKNHLTGRELISGDYRIAQYWMSPCAHLHITGGWFTQIFSPSSPEDPIYSLDVQEFEYV